MLLKLPRQLDRVKNMKIYTISLIIFLYIALNFGGCAGRTTIDSSMKDNNYRLLNKDVITEKEISNVKNYIEESKAGAIGPDSVVFAEI